MSVQALVGRIDSYFIGSGISTVASLASIAVQADDDTRDNNIRALKDLQIDVDTLSKTVGDLLVILRNNRLIPNP